MKANNESMLRELEKTVISLDGMLRQKLEGKSNAVQDRICTQWVAKMRAKYNITDKSWTKTHNSKE